MSAFGGIVALNHEVDDATAAILSETFLECIIAPGFAVGALAKLRTKAQLRLLTTNGWLGRNHKALQFKRVGGGFAVQERDASGFGEVQAGRVVTKRQPTALELSALEFAWSACKHVKSNAIVLAGPGHSPGIYATLGIGGGQTARVTAVQVACRKSRRPRQRRRARLRRLLPLRRRPASSPPAPASSPSPNPAAAKKTTKSSKPPTTPASP